MLRKKKHRIIIRVGFIAFTIIQLLFSSFPAVYAQTVTPTIPVTHTPTPQPTGLVKETVQIPVTVEDVPAEEVSITITPTPTGAVLGTDSEEQQTTTPSPTPYVIEEILREEPLDDPEFIERESHSSDIKLYPLDARTYHANQKIDVTVEKDPDTNVGFYVLGDNDTRTPAQSIQTYESDTISTFEVIPPQNLAPDTYTLEVVDGEGNSFTQDFTWGVLAINTTKSMYSPEETAQLQMAVLNRLGEMVCDAKVTLDIYSPSAQKTTISTDNGSITVNPECRIKDKVDVPDYEATYQTQESGKYTMVLEAETNAGIFKISDTFEVRDYIPFDVERNTATRIYPPIIYDVQMKIKAQEDFKGTLKEYVPSNFKVSQLDGVLPFNNTSQQDNTAESVLGVSADALIVPFDAPVNITTHFGEIYDDRSLIASLIKFGIDGHDGADFALEEGTPILATDQGEVTFAGRGDYGVTVIIEHSWGKSMYGHLSAVSVEVGDSVLKGDQIGLAGSTGLSTGSHLHFSVEPLNPQKDNGYNGMVDPLPYLGLSQSQVLGETTITGDNQVLSWNIDIKAGDEFTIGYSYKAPNVSPEFYTLGPLQFVDHEDVSVNVFKKILPIEGQEKQTKTQSSELSITPSPTDIVNDIIASPTASLSPVASPTAQLSQSPTPTPETPATPSATITETPESIPTEISDKTLSSYGLEIVTEETTQQHSNIRFEEVRVWQIAVDGTENVDPNVDLTTGFPTCTGTGCGTGHYEVLDDFGEGGLDTSNYVSTGTAGAGGEVEEFGMTGTDSTTSVTQVDVYVNADVAACNGGTCDDLTLDISLDGSYTGTTNTVTLSTGNTTYGPGNGLTWTGTWTGWDDLQVKITRNVQGGGKPDTRDDDVRIYMVYATVTYLSGIDISGTCDQYDRATDCTDDGANQIRVAVNGTLDSAVDTTVDGAWTLSSVVVASGDTITVFIDGEATASERANAVTLYDGTGNITGVTLYQRHLTIGSDDNATVTFDDIDDYDNSVSADADIFFDGYSAVDTEHILDVDTSSTYSDDVFYILGNNAYTHTDGGAITDYNELNAHDIYVEASGTLTINGYTITTISGSFINNGVFDEYCTLSSSYGYIVFTSTSTGEVITGNFDGTDDMCRVDFFGSGGGWTITDPLLVSGADQTDTFDVSAGTVTLGDGGGDHLEVAGRFTVATGATFQTVSGLAQGDGTDCNTDDICIDINNFASPATCTNCDISLAGTLDIGTNATLRLNSHAATANGVTLTQTGYLEVRGSLDDSGTDTGTDSLTLRETLICATDTWTTDLHNNKWVRIVDGFAKGKFYQITDTIAGDTNCLTDTDDSITIADTSTTNTTVASIVDNTTSYVVCATDNQISANDEGVGRYLRDQTGTTGYYLIVDSVNADASNCSTQDSFTVISDPDDPSTLSNIATSDAIDISDGFKDGDQFEIVDFAAVTANTTNNGFIHSPSGGEAVVKYAEISELGAETANQYGLNFEGVDGANINEGVSIQYSYFHDNHRSIRFNNGGNINASFTVNGESQGIRYNYITDASQDGINYSSAAQAMAGDIVGNRVETVGGNKDCITMWTSGGNLVADNIVIDCDPGIEIQYEDGNMVVGNRAFVTSTGSNGSQLSGIEIVNGGTGNVIANNLSFSNSGDGIHISGTTAQDHQVFGNYTGVSTDGIYLTNSANSTLLTGHNVLGSAANTTADLTIAGTGTHTVTSYNNAFYSSTETSGFGGTEPLMSFMHDQTSTSEVIGTYTIPNDDATTPQDEGTETFNYADATFEDGITPHYYFGTGTEDTDIGLAFSGGTLGGTEDVYAYFIRCKNANCVTSGTNAWDVFRNGADVGDASTGSTFTDATTNVQFNIADAGTDYNTGDAYLFVAYRSGDDTNTQKTLDFSAASSSYTVGSGETVALVGDASNNTLLTGTGGAYSFDITGGTINANYYTMTGADAGGLTITSGTATSLNNGTYDDIAVGSGHYITVAPGVLDSNGAKTWTGMVFDDGTADSNSPGNVILTPSIDPTGGCSVLWTFESTGNIGGSSNGESNDTDHGDGVSCTGSNGYIQWTDPGGATRTLDATMRHGAWFNNGVEQPFDLTF